MKIVELASVASNEEETFQRLFSQVSSHVDARLIANLNKVAGSTHQALLTVEDEGKIVGAMIVSLHQKVGSLEVKADDVVVDEGSRGKGYAKALMIHAINWAKQQGADYMELTSSSRRQAANSLYKTLGFKIRETNVFKLEF